MRRWTFALDLDPSAERPLFVQIADGIARGIRQGRLKPGEPLLGARALSKQLLVNRNTVAAAYTTLIAEGWVTTKHGLGTFVSADLPPKLAHHARPPRRRESTGFPLASAPASKEDPSIEAGLFKWDFGSPDARLAPRKELARSFRRALKDKRFRYLDYQRYRSESVSPLQRALATMLRTSRAVNVEPEDVEITRGSQMAIYLVARALLAPGDVVAVEDPGYYAAASVFRSLGCKLLPIRVDEHGLCVDHLEAHLEKKSIRAVFVTPHHQFPTTVTLSQARRLALLSLARRHSFAIIEDDFDYEFHYDGRPILPLASDDDQDVVIHIGSLSKIVAPALRLGYVTGPSSLVRAVRQLRRMVDGHGDLLLDAALADLFEEGEMQRHINRARRIYRARRDLLAQLLADRLGTVLSFARPSGGMAIWARVGEGQDAENWAARAKRKGLLVRTGRLFSVSDARLPFVRLGFARMNEREMISGIDVLVRALD